ncbi:unnamed protein product [Rhizophagus irregularis]|nr:unnamed protein product [Rhizophagus irregularis]
MYVLVLYSIIYTKKDFVAELVECYYMERLEVFEGDGRDYVWRKPEEKYNVDCSVPTFKSDRKGVMMITLKFIVQDQLCVGFQIIILINFPGPDLNPIKNIWDELERHIRRPKNEVELFNLLEEEWFVEGTSRRVQAS